VIEKMGLLEKALEIKKKNENLKLNDKIFDY